MKEVASRPAVFAHRGRLPGFRENTVEAFAECAQLGADGVELDVRATADGALVVSHDPAIEGVGIIAELDVGALPSWVPILEAVVEVCTGVIVNVEIKNDPGEPGFDSSGGLAAAVAWALAGHEDHVVVSSFDLPTLDSLHATRPEIPTAWLTLRLAEPAAELARLADVGHKGINPLHLSVDPGLVEAAHDLGLTVSTWTVDEAARMMELAGWGVDVLFTNELLLALSTLHG